MEPSNPRFQKCIGIAPFDMPGWQRQIGNFGKGGPVQEDQLVLRLLGHSYFLSNGEILRS
jgi:hypothetical protein